MIDSVAFDDRRWIMNANRSLESGDGSCKQANQAEEADCADAITYPAVPCLLVGSTDYMPLRNGLMFHIFLNSLKSSLAHVKMFSRFFLKCIRLRGAQSERATLLSLIDTVALARCELDLFPDNDVSDFLIGARLHVRLTIFEFGDNGL